VAWLGTRARLSCSRTACSPATPGNCAPGSVADGGHNLSYGDGTCPSGFLGGDPKLGRLQSNGGPPPTMALGSGSAAIDQIPAQGAGVSGCRSGRGAPAGWTGLRHRRLRGRSARAQHGSRDGQPNRRGDLEGHGDAELEQRHGGVRVRTQRVARRRAQADPRLRGDARQRDPRPDRAAAEYDLPLPGQRDYRGGHDHVGLNRVRFSGDVRRVALAPGRYRLQLAARANGRRVRRGASHSPPSGWEASPRLRAWPTPSP
jgi:hypothetical protein